MTDAPACNNAATAARSTAPRQRIQVRRSGVHGKGVFALQDIAEGERVIEYVGEVITWSEAQRRHPHDPKDPNHTFYFHVDDQPGIDAKHGGNSSRWINHACDPNCEADEEEGRVFIKALRNIRAGEELNYDYGLSSTSATRRSSRKIRVPLRQLRVPPHDALAEAMSATARPPEGANSLGEAVARQPEGRP